MYICKVFGKIEYDVVRATVLNYDCKRQNFNAEFGILYLHISGECYLEIKLFKISVSIFIICVFVFNAL